MASSVIEMVSEPAAVVVSVIRRLRLFILDSMLPWLYWSVAMHLIPWNLRAKLTPEYVLYRKSHAAVAVSKLISEVRML